MSSTATLTHQRLQPLYVNVLQLPSQRAETGVRRVTQLQDATSRYKPVVPSTRVTTLTCYPAHGYHATVSNRSPNLHRPHQGPIILLGYPPRIYPMQWLSALRIPAPEHLAIVRKPTDWPGETVHCDGVLVAGTTRDKTKNVCVFADVFLFPSFSSLRGARISTLVPFVGVSSVSRNSIQTTPSLLLTHGPIFGIPVSSRDASLL